jgi:hypothetical protein
MSTAGTGGVSTATPPTGDTGGSASGATAGSASIAIGGASGATLGIAGIGGVGGGVAAAGDGGGGIIGTGVYCQAFPTAAGTIPVKGGACVDTDIQSCYRTCGPDSIGWKPETCLGGVYVEGSCEFPPGGDYTCFKIPAAIDPACPVMPPQASTPCDASACTPCNAGGAYLDSTGAPKIGYCICPAPGASGISKWSCATESNWPCPGPGQGC